MHCNRTAADEHSPDLTPVSIMNDSVSGLWLTGHYCCNGKNFFLNLRARHQMRIMQVSKTPYPVRLESYDVSNAVIRAVARNGPFLENG
ncbi:hypothetical protein HZH66_010108 [Vespula vulgaris]|uniref:Uncharacterized protein n=1 Tax=Vespula vulgaris TaxID=7454 RepID=A0A834JIA5_VESVU|nr:hypothetical protein HZH66_010108 [Vespula vulgaris]